MPCSFHTDLAVNCSSSQTYLEIFRTSSCLSINGGANMPQQWCQVHIKHTHKSLLVKFSQYHSVCEFSFRRLTRTFLFFSLTSPMLVSCNHHHTKILTKYSANDNYMIFYMESKSNAVSECFVAFKVIVSILSSRVSLISCISYKMP